MVIQTVDFVATVLTVWRKGGLRMNLPWCLEHLEKTGNKLIFAVVKCRWSSVCIDELLAFSGAFSDHHALYG